MPAGPHGAPWLVGHRFVSRDNGFPGPSGCQHGGGAGMACFVVVVFFWGGEARKRPPHHCQDACRTHYICDRSFGEIKRILVQLALQKRREDFGDAFNQSSFPGCEFLI